MNGVFKRFKRSSTFFASSSTSLSIVAASLIFFKIREMKYKYIFQDPRNEKEFCIDGYDLLITIERLRYPLQYGGEQLCDDIVSPCRITFSDEYNNELMKAVFP
ncbi:hypothetical protein KIN20_015995 [Parelaphostrongylus tenuis]|uniref:Uncharacterized protein n=1 Tax=Parelaphostrongylus tenuis TaxID=148309 RepID=A0AAD5QSV4_PARTN|nr:hypothetical protein KIN20_015995 [Parelaphostrongylus tenuis]